MINELIYCSRLVVCACSSIGQSVGLRNRRLEVRVLSGVLCDTSEMTSGIKNQDRSKFINNKEITATTSERSDRPEYLNHSINKRGLYKSFRIGP